MENSAVTVCTLQGMADAQSGQLRPARPFLIGTLAGLRAMRGLWMWGYGAGVSFRLAAYAVCIESGRVLLARYVPPAGESSWTLPGGRVEHGEDPYDAVIREFAEETGCDAVIERLLGVDSRVIPAAERRLPGSLPHQNVGIFYRVRITGGRLRAEPDGEIAESVWTPVPCVARLRRSSLVDVGLALAQSLPATGHVDPVPVGGLVQH
jgi:8-oxo-dGTP diphosphatase